MINFCPSCGHPFPSIDLECLLFFDHGPLYYYKRIPKAQRTVLEGWFFRRDYFSLLKWMNKMESLYQHCTLFFFPLLALFCAQPTNHIGSAMESLQCWTTAAWVLVVQIEIKSQQLCELLKQQHELASIHNKKRLLLHFGWSPWLRLLSANRWRLHWASETLTWSVSLV
jgi:hypothetical protein